jgi:hypothetical protein
MEKIIFFTNPDRNLGPIHFTIRIADLQRKTIEKETA